MYVPHLPPFAMPCVLLLQFNPGKDIWNQSSCTSSHYIACCRSPSMVEALLINVLVPACHYPAPVLSTSTMTKSNSVQWPRTIYSSSALEREREEKRTKRSKERSMRGWVHPWRHGAILVGHKSSTVRHMSLTPIILYVQHNKGLPSIFLDLWKLLYSSKI